MNKDPVKPVVAAINGHAIAGGMELVQGTDIRIAVPEAKFGLQEVKWAIFLGRFDGKNAQANALRQSNGVDADR